MQYHAGELDKRITFKRETLTPDGIGGHTVNLSDIATVWALARPMSGREIERYDQLNATALYLFVVRNRQDVKEDDRIIWDGEEYNIRFLKSRGGRSLYLEIVAERGVAQ